MSAVSEHTIETMGTKSRFAVVAAAVCSVVAGCGIGGDVTPLARQDEAIAIVWSSYGMTGTPPSIHWFRDDCTILTNHGTLAHYHGVSSEDCNPGAYNDYYDVVQLGVGPHEMFSQQDTPFAHELMHAAQQRRGVYDPGHAIASDWGRVQAADDALKAAGL